MRTLRAGRITASVERGIVTLRGHVRRTRDLTEVCRLAWLVPGVIDVVNRVTVGTSRPPIESPDAAGIG